MRTTTPNPLVEPLRCAAPFSAYACDLPAAPLEKRGPLVLQCVHQLLRGVEAAGFGQPTLWLDTKELHKDGGSRLLGVHARKWSPRMGFCFDPAGPPPRKMQLSDLMDMEYGSVPRIDDRTAIHVSRLSESASAYQAIAGRGLSVLLCFGDATAPGAAENSVAAYMQNTQTTLRPLMAPGQFQTFPFYLPLITPESVVAANAEQLALWLGTADLYLRESAGEVLMLSRRGLEPALAAAGLQRLQPEDGSAWAFPAGLPAKEGQA